MPCHNSAKIKSKQYKSDGFFLCLSRTFHTKQNQRTGSRLHIYIYIYIEEIEVDTAKYETKFRSTLTTTQSLTKRKEQSMSPLFYYIKLHNKLPQASLATDFSLPYYCL